MVFRRNSVTFSHICSYALLYGRPPFETSDVKKTYKKIKECQYSFNEDINISQMARNLISKMLVVDPYKRLTLDQVRDHPFLNEHKIPRNLPTSILAAALPKSYHDQYPRGRSSLTSQFSKNFEKT